MSVDYLLPSSTPSQKRRRQTTTSTSSFNSKCGEIFVTPDYNKWTYNCGFCQLTTSDIGVFICHIRLQHSYFESKTNESTRNNTTHQREHSNIQNECSENDSDSESCSSIEDSIIKEEEIIHESLMSEEASESYNKHHDSLDNSDEKTKLPTVMANNEAFCSKVTKIFNLETLIVRNCDGGGKKQEAGGRKEKGSGRKDKAGGSNKPMIRNENKSSVPSPHLSTSRITDYLKLGTYKVMTIQGRSKIWELFGWIVNSDGETLQNIVACSKCLNVFKYDRRTTSNLWRHKCVKEIEYI